MCETPGKIHISDEVVLHTMVFKIVNRVFNPPLVHHPPPPRWFKDLKTSQDRIGLKTP